MKKMALFVVLATTALSSAPVLAATQNDVTAAQEWAGGAPVSPVVWADTIGGGSPSVFQTSRITASYNTTNGRTTFNVYSNMSIFGTTVGSTFIRMADFFFDLDNNSSWDHALQLQIDPISGKATGGTFVTLTGSQSSDDLFKSTNLSYGGAYRPNGNNGNGTSPVPVVAQGAADPAISVFSFGPQIAESLTVCSPATASCPTQTTDKKLTFVLSGLDPSTFNILWGTAVCANDVITGDLTTVPLPAALPMFLGALASLGVVGRRRRA